MFLIPRLPAPPLTFVEDLSPMLIPPLSIDIIPASCPASWPANPCAAAAHGVLLPGLPSLRKPSQIECVDDAEDDEEDLGDEEDLAGAQPAADEESNFDDFDDEFDDDFEEEENDPDWDHPDDSAPETPPPGKGGGRKK
jgi:hypothetical protein